MQPETSKQSASEAYRTSTPASDRSLWCTVVDSLLTLQGITASVAERHAVAKALQRLAPVQPKDAA